MRRLAALVAFLACVFLVQGAVTPPKEPPDFLKIVDKIAQTYRDYDRPDRYYRFSPADCIARLPEVPTMHVSASSDPTTHGRKLYTIFARWLHWDQSRNPSQHHLYTPTKVYLPPLTKASQQRFEEGERYWTLERGHAPVGQVIVKEAWHYQEISEQEYQREREGQHPDRKSTRGLTGSFWPGYDLGKQLLPLAETYADKQADKRYYRANGLAGLFIMTKLDPGTPGTDAGWIYATVAADLKTVTDVGRVANCMKCHQDAPHDRLFGLR